MNKEPKIKGYEVDDGITIYKYDNKEYREWKSRGEEHGDCGMLLIAENDDLIIMEGYGTPEKPIKSMMRVKALKVKD